MKIKIPARNWKVIAATIKAGGKADPARLIPVTIEYVDERLWVWATNSYTLAAAPLEGTAPEPFTAPIDASFFAALGKLCTPRSKGVDLEIDLDGLTISASVPWPDGAAKITITAPLHEKFAISDWRKLLPSDVDPALIAETWLNSDYAALGPAFFSVTDAHYPIRHIGGGGIKATAWQSKSGATWLIMPVRATR